MYSYLHNMATNYWSLVSQAGLQISVVQMRRVIQSLVSQYHYALYEVHEVRSRQAISIQVDNEKGNGIQAQFGKHSSQISNITGFSVSFFTAIIKCSEKIEKFQTVLYSPCKLYNLNPTNVMVIVCACTILQLYPDMREH